MLMISLKCDDQQVFVPTPGLIAWPGPSVHSREPRKSSALNTSFSLHCYTATQLERLHSATVQSRPLYVAGIEREELGH